MYHQAPDWAIHKPGKHLKENIISQNLKASSRGHKKKMARFGGLFFVPPAIWPIGYCVKWKSLINSEL